MDVCFILGGNPVLSAWGILSVHATPRFGSYAPYVFLPWMPHVLVGVLLPTMIATPTVTQNNKANAFGVSSQTVTTAIGSHLDNNNHSGSTKDWSVDTAPSRSVVKSFTTGFFDLVIS